MRKLNFYSFHRNIGTYRFDNYNSMYLEEKLNEDFDIIRYDLDGEDGFIFNGVNINHGSILIFEYNDTKKFKIYDFGDSPYLTTKLSNTLNFESAILGQYNSKFWDNNIKNPILRKKIHAGVYPETIWQCGMLNYQNIKSYRKSIKLDKRLFWRGSLYNSGVPMEYLGIRKSIELIPSYIPPKDLYFRENPIPFEDYIKEASSFSLVLSMGGGGGVSCGDICFRDIEMFGLGIPLIRPKYIVQMNDPLIPNFHYISINPEFDNEFKYKNPILLSKLIIKRYLDVIRDEVFLDFISNNARDWYIKNISHPNITNNILNLLQL